MRTISGLEGEKQVVFREPAAGPVNRPTQWVPRSTGPVYPTRRRTSESSEEEPYDPLKGFEFSMLEFGKFE